MSHIMWTRKFIAYKNVWAGLISLNAKGESRIMINAKPCKHCGAAPIVYSRVYDHEWGGPAIWNVRCPKCKNNRSMMHPTECAAIEAWNKLQEKR